MLHNKALPYSSRLKQMRPALDRVAPQHFEA